MTQDPYGTRASQASILARDKGEGRKGRAWELAVNEAYGDGTFQGVYSQVPLVRALETSLASLLVPTAVPVRC
jgi:hypothetical protein